MNFLMCVVLYCTGILCGLAIAKINDRFNRY